MEYSIAIRTLGRAKDKIEKLISSIKRLRIQPKEVIIVMPRGYTFPDIDLENKRIVYSEKGMLVQRIIGYEEATTKYVLLIDDDIEFKENLIEELYEPIKNKMCEISFPIYKELLLNGGIKSLVSIFTASSFPNKKSKMNFVKFMDSGGFIYNGNLNNSDKYLYSQSAPGMCIFGKVDVFKKITLRDELWVDNVRYPLRDDAITIYKAFLMDYKIIGVQGIEITHLDGGSSEKNRNVNEAYAGTYNHILFWKRFIYNYKKASIAKIKASICLGYWVTSMFIYHSLKLLVKRDFTIFKHSVKGIKDGVNYIGSKEQFRCGES